jgi:hypothetical protein
LAACASWRGVGVAWVWSLWPGVAQDGVIVTRWFGAVR